jgi:hypothetical protein
MADARFEVENQPIGPRRRVLGENFPESGAL